MLKLLVLIFASTSMALRSTATLKLTSMASQYDQGNPCEKFHGIGAICRRGIKASLGCKQKKCRCMKEHNAVLSSQCGTLAGEYKFDPNDPRMLVQGCACITKGQSAVDANNKLVLQGDSQPATLE